jgi:hypothetical protein
MDIMEEPMDKPLVIDTPEGIAMFQYTRCMYALKLEAKGMKMSRSGSILKYVQQNYGIKARTKAGAYEEMQARLDEWKAAGVTDE